MKVFIGWSKELSQAIAEVLGDWLPKVIQKVETFVSSQDIEKGALWEAELRAQLSEATFAVLCLTPENKDSPWILFEAGILSENEAVRGVCPVAFGGLTKADITGPLSSRQQAEFEERDMLQLVQSINSALGDEALSGELLAESFDRRWSDLREAVEQTEAGHPNPVQVRPRKDRELLEEILQLVRQRQRPLASSRAVDLRVPLSAAFGIRCVLSELHASTEPMSDRARWLRTNLGWQLARIERWLSGFMDPARQDVAWREYLEACGVPDLEPVPEPTPLQVPEDDPDTEESEADETNDDAEA